MEENGVEDLRVSRRVSTWEGNSAAQRGGSGAGDSDVGAGIVELSTSNTTPLVESKNFATKKVVTRSKAARQGELPPPIVSNQGVNCPCFSGGV